MKHAPATRDEAIGTLVSRSLTRPANVLPGAAVLAAGIALGIWPLAVAGVAVYGLLAATTFFSRREQRRALGLPDQPGGRATAGAGDEAPDPSVRDPEVLARYDEVRTEYRRVREAIAGSPVPLPEIEVETAGLMDDVTALCRRAQAVRNYLVTVDEPRLRTELARAQDDLAHADPEVAPALHDTVDALGRQLSTIDGMRGRLRAFDAQMRQVSSSLGAIRGEVARLAIESEADDSGRLAEQVGSARALVTGLAESLEREERPGGAGPAGAAGAA